ncbi:MAG TPA: molecular chaperone HtpG [Acholeplasmataceae bacterium]|nr:molecular chaperone HtpG [Acholeplasmataceae bacterium]
MAEIREFKTESKRLLDLMINSIYTNKEIFLRELISNASDAIDKYHYLSLTTSDLPKRNDYEIFIEFDKKKKTITIKDNGIGMTYDELHESLGTIAKSGTLEFFENLKKKEKKDVELIGQFGVGFYSAFMVAKEVEVKTRSLLDTKGYLFKSKGTDTYEVSEIDKDESGTEIIIHLRNNDDEFEYDQFLDEWKLKNLVKKYSDYIRYPIKMEVTKREKKEGTEDEYEDVKIVETLNSMTPIWKKPKNEIKDEELNEFYKQKFYDFEDPFLHMLINVEGKLNYTALVFIPKKPPLHLYSEKYEKGLQLYCKDVFIMDKCKELVPDYLRFIKGLVDSADLSLNISREMLQKSKQLQEIASNVEKRIISRLENLLKNDYDKYVEFFKVYGVNLKYGIYDNFGLKKELLQDLILYETTNTDKLITLKEYVEAMPKDQEFIYYASGKSKAAVMAMPQMDIIKKKGYNVLVLTDDVDEFAINVMHQYNKKQFKAINQGDLNLLDEEEKEKIKTLNEEKKPLLDKIKEVLKDEVTNVVLSERLTESAVCLVSTEGISFEMEKVIANMPSDEKPKAEKILEINPNHQLFKALEKIYLENPLEIEDYAHLLYSQALLIEGFELEDPLSFANKINELIIKSAK